MKNIKNILIGAVILVVFIGFNYWSYKASWIGYNNALVIYTEDNTQKLQITGWKSRGDMIRIDIKGGGNILVHKTKIVLMKQ